MSCNSDNYPDCFSFAAPGANLLLRFSSSFATNEKSPLFAKRAFRIWSAREDYASLREAPCGPLLTQRCLAALGSNLLRRFSSSFAANEKSPLFAKRAFRIWSAREDSNLRPTGPKPVALPSCATRRFCTACYCLLVLPGAKRGT